MAARFAVLCVFLLATFIEAFGYPEKRILIEDNYYDIISKLNNLTAEVEKLKAVSVHQPVAFQAFLTSQMTGTSKQIVLFDDVRLNIGNGYKPLHGNFIAPVAGTYMFTVHVCSGQGHAMVLDLMLNGDSIGRVLAAASDNHECNTGVWIRTLDALDDVYVSTGTYGDLLYVNTLYGEPNFIGVLLSV